VDCCVAPILWRLKTVDIVLPERSTKPLQKYMQKIFERPSFRESLTEAELEMQD
jgi:stringent starvation protein A